MLIYLNGDEDFLIKEKLNFLKEKFKKEKNDPSGSNIFIFSDKDIYIDDLNKTIFSVSLFSEKRMIILENIFESKRDNDFYLGIIKVFKEVKKGIDNILIVSEHLDNIQKLKKEQKELAKQILALLNSADYKIFCNKLNSQELIQWIIDRFSKKNITINKQIAHRLNYLTEGNLWRLSNEIDKLINWVLSQNRTVLNMNDLNLLVEDEIVEKIFILLDKIFQKDKKNALFMIKKFLKQGNDASYVFSMILWQLRQLLLITSCIEEMKILSILQIAKHTGLNSFVVRKNFNLAKNYSLDKLKNLYNKLLDYDIKIKTGVANPVLILDIIAMTL